MAHRPRLRIIRRLALGFGAGIAGGWFAGLLSKPKPATPVGSRVPAAQPDREGAAGAAGAAS